MSAESEWKLRRALALSKGGLEQARLALRAYDRKQQQRLWIAGGVGGALALVLIVGLALLRSTRRGDAKGAPSLHSK